MALFIPLCKHWSTTSVADSCCTGLVQQSILSLSLCILYWDISDCKRKLWYRNKPETHPSNLFDREWNSRSLKRICWIIRLYPLWSRFNVCMFKMDQTWIYFIIFNNFVQFWIFLARKFKWFNFNRISKCEKSFS